MKKKSAHRSGHVQGLDAVWSDGKPVTGADFVATWKVYVNPKTTSSAERGGRTCKSVKVSGKGSKTFTVVFKKHVRGLGVDRSPAASTRHTSSTART